MRHRIVLVCLLLAACKDDTASLPDPVAITADATGYYCQMALSEHAGPKGQIHLEGTTAPIFFSQARDTLAYLMMPEQSHAVTAAYVQDMSNVPWDNPGPWILAKEALYVVGSDAKGGMGAPEFVPFADEQAAQAFILEHGGHVRRFADLTTADTLGATAHNNSSDDDTDDMSQRLKQLSKSEGRAQ